MFEKLKNIISGVGIVFKYGDIISSVVTAWNSFPGLDDSPRLKKWIKPLLLDASTLALATKTTIDDAITIAALRIVDNERSWNAVHAMALLVRDGGLFKDGVLVPESQAYTENLNVVNDVAKDISPGCPALVHAAIGLILFLLQQRFSK